MKYKWLFAKLIQNSKSTTKLTKTNQYFSWTFSLPYSSHKFRLFTKMSLIFIIFYFLKMTFLLFQPHHLQIFTRMSLSSIHQPNNQLKVLNALQIDLHFFFLNSNELKTSLSLSLCIHPKNPKILILKFLWFIEPLNLTILGV